MPYNRPFLYDYQKAILDSKARFTVTEAATKVGKTASHIIWDLEQAIHFGNTIGKGAKVWWVAPVYRQATIAFERMRNQIQPHNFFKVNESKLRLTLPTGSMIEFLSAEKADNLYGDDVHAAVFDEFPRAREAAWIALRTTLTATKGKCKLIGNVKGTKNWGARLAQRAKAGQEGYEYFKITAWDAVDAGLLDRAEIEQAQRDLPEAAFRELYEAEPMDDGSNPFGTEFIKAAVRGKSDNPPVCFGVDLAKSVDWTVIVGLDADRNMCYYDRFQKDWNQTEEVIKRLQDVSCFMDSTGVGDPITERLQKQRQNIEGYKFTSNSKQQLMEGLQSSLQMGKIGIYNETLIDEMKAFEFEYTRTGVKYSAPEGLHDDCVCALALADMAFERSKTKGQYSIM